MDITNYDGSVNFGTFFLADLIEGILFGFDIEFFADQLALNVIVFPSIPRTVTIVVSRFFI
jgi:hypothetical protein